MQLSMYDISVPVYRQFLMSLVSVLDKAIEHCKANNVDEASLIGTRLFDDMQPFAFQVMQSVNHSAGALALIRGASRERPAARTSFADMKKDVLAAIADIDAIKPADLEGTANKTVELKFPGREMKFSGLGYLQSFAMPQFFFHATTAYDILRHKGVPIGKRDYLGQIQLLTEPA